jgi:hypothetical protein
MLKWAQQIAWSMPLRCTFHIRNVWARASRSPVPHRTKSTAPNTGAHSNPIGSETLSSRLVSGASTPSPGGEVQARRALALLLQAEKARDEAAACKSEAEQQLVPIEEALRKARALRALAGDGGFSQQEAFLKQSWIEAQA